MRKKVVAFMLAISMTFTFCACGASEDSSSETAQEDSASDTEGAVEESSVEDTEEESDAGEAVSESVDEETEENEEENEEVNEYGFTESQQEALVESVKNAITTDFLEPYNISPSEFELQPYDVNDWSNYDLFGDYIGDDPYMTSRNWYVADNAIFVNTNLYLYASEISLTSVEFVAKYDIEPRLESGTLTIASTAEESGMSLSGSEESIALGNAMYKGIAEFLNSLDTGECAELLANLGWRFINRETVAIPITVDSSSTRSYPATTVFDKVITENIQFE